jgi:hypothetical protein
VLGCSAASGDESIESSDGRVCVDPSATLDDQRLASELVNNVQELQDLPVGGLVELVVKRPHVIWMLC